MKRLLPLLAALTLVGCERDPRSVSYFEAHPDEASAILKACRDGHHRGGECDTAAGGLAAVEATKRMERFRRSFE